MYRTIKIRRWGMRKTRWNRYKNAKFMLSRRVINNIQKLGPLKNNLSINNQNRPWGEKGKALALWGGATGEGRSADTQGGNTCLHLIILGYVCVFYFQINKIIFYVLCGFGIRAENKRITNMYFLIEGCWKQHFGPHSGRPCFSPCV